MVSLQRPNRQLFPGASLFTGAQSDQIDEAGKARFGSGSRFKGLCRKDAQFKQAKGKGHAGMMQRLRA